MCLEYNGYKTKDYKRNKRPKNELKLTKKLLKLQKTLVLKKQRNQISIKAKPRNFLEK